MSYLDPMKTILNLRYATLLLLALLFSTELLSQFEVSHIDERASGDLILYSQAFGRTTYLVNQCGDIINQWEHDNRAGYTARLMDDGNMMRAEYVDFGCCDQTSRGGRLQILDWDQNVLWDYLVAKETETHHHDYIIMPSGNIMHLGWEVLDRAAMDELGIQPGPNELWAEFVREVRPIGRDSYELIWEWNLKHHLIQDRDSDQANYRPSIEDHLGKVDPHKMNTPREGKWHVNALEYDPVRDVVMINSRDNREFWILDHSTTIEEATGDEGGRAGKGGQILFRWGNPSAYGRGDVGDIQMFGSHGLTIIPEGQRFENYILFFNNDQISPTQQRFSTVELIKPLLDADGNYVLDADSTYMLEDHIIVYGEDQDTQPLFSPFMSNAEQLETGYLINEGSRGRIFEINEDKEVVWEMRSTFFSDDVFRAYSYPLDFIGFEGRDLSPISTEFHADGFELCDTPSSTDDPISALRLYPNPASQHIDVHVDQAATLELKSADQQRLARYDLHVGVNRVTLNGLAPGL